MNATFAHSPSVAVGNVLSDAEMQTINIVKDDFHGDWNYVIRPRVRS